MAAKTKPETLRARLARLERQVLVAERLRFESLRGKSSKRLDASVFVAGVAHEFNNILGAADGHAEWGLESGDPADMREALQTVRLACRRSAQITQSLQGLFQPREEKKSLFPLKDSFAELARLFKARLLRDRVKLVCKAPAIKIYGDPVRMQEVFVNLVKNALEAGNAKRIEITAHVRRGKKSRLVIRVQDDGPGVPKLYRDLVFQPFFTTKGTFAHAVDAKVTEPAAQGGGSGLGLYLSRQVIEEHGGQLRYVDTPRGACFEVELPL